MVHASDHRTSILPYQHVELLARQSPFDDWTVTGDFEDRPLSEGDSVQVWRLK